MWSFLRLKFCTYFAYPLFWQTGPARECWLKLMPDAQHPIKVCRWDRNRFFSMQSHPNQHTGQNRGICDFPFSGIACAISLPNCPCYGANYLQCNWAKSSCCTIRNRFEHWVATMCWVLARACKPSLRPLGLGVPHATPWSTCAPRGGAIGTPPGAQWCSGCAVCRKAPRGKHQSLLVAKQQQNPQW